MRNLLVFIIAVVAFAIPVSVLAQPDSLWQRHFANVGDPLRVVQTHDGGYALGNTGFYDEVRRLDFHLIKTDSLGEFEWDEYYIRDTTSRRSDNLSFIQQLPDGGFAMVGQSAGRMLVRTDEDGQMLWFRYWQGGADGSIGIARNGDILTAGPSQVRRWSNEGDLVWVNEYNMFYTIRRIITSMEGGFLLAGHGGGNLRAVKIDDDGEIEWSVAYGTEHTDYCLAVIQTSNRDYIMSGVSKFGRDPREGYALLVKMDSNGELIWLNLYEDLRGYKFSLLSELSDGGFIIMGYYSSEILRVTRVDFEGEVLWISSSYGPGNGYGGSVFALADGGYFFSYHSSTGNAFRNMPTGAYLIRTEPDTLVIPFELEPLSDEIVFEEVKVDSIAFAEVALHNFGKRYAIFDSLWFDEEESHFDCLLELPVRLSPLDTLFAPISLSPIEEGEFHDTLRLRYQNGDYLEVPLFGRGVSLRAPQDDLTPLSYALNGIFPNPFNSSTLIRYALPSASEVRLDVYDISGRRVTNLLNDKVQVGEHSLVWDASSLSAGVYLIRFTAGDYSQVQKAVLVK